MSNGFWRGMIGLRLAGSESYILGRDSILYEYREVKANPLEYIDECGRIWRCNRHFLTDMGSVPRAFRWLIDKDSFIRAFLYHDDLYEHRGLWLLTGHGWALQDFNRRQADDMLYVMARAEGANKATAAAIWAAVRIGGWVPWDRRTTDSVDKDRKTHQPPR